MDRLSDLLAAATPTADRPLTGLTLLLVEDSRLACEGMRLLCRRSGARLRRADSLLAAERHLRSYRPGALIVDLHLPDGSGLDLIRATAQARPRIDAILATSGDPSAEAAARAAGADGFLPKPATGAALHAALLRALPLGRPPSGLPPPFPDKPDTHALREDLEHAAALLAETHPRLDYVAGFLHGVARSAGDLPLERAARHAAPRDNGARLLSRFLRQRLAASP